MPYRRLLAPVLVSLALLGAACAAEEADPAPPPEAAPTTGQEQEAVEPSESDAAPTTTEDQPTVTTVEAEAAPDVAPTAEVEASPAIEEAPEVEPDTAPEPGPEATPEPDTAPDAEVTPESEPEAEPEATPESEPEAEPEVTPESEPEAEPEVTPESEPEAEPEVTPESEPEAEPEVTPESEPEAEPEVTPEPDTAPDAEVTPESEPEAEPVERPSGTADSDRAALVALYNAMNGPNWPNSANWLTAAPLNEWFGVITDSSTGRVIHLTLPYNNLRGQLPPELGDLTALEELNFLGNFITDDDLPALSYLPSLRRLFLSQNFISDVSALSSLTRLEILDLFDNGISDIAPLLNLPNLRHLSIEYNSLTARSFEEHIPDLIARDIGVNFSRPATVGEDFTVEDGPQVYNDNVFILPVEPFEPGEPVPQTDHAASFYEHFEDEFDFLMFVALNRVSLGTSNAAWYTAVTNDVQGIGSAIISESDRWGSAGKLQGVILFTAVHEFSLASHELMHRWGAFILPGEVSDGAHWLGISDAYGVLGWDVAVPFDEIVEIGENTYSATSPPAVESLAQTFGPLELYLAGFIPPEEVPEFWVAPDAEWVEWFRTFTTSEIRRYTIDDVIAAHGKRVPEAAAAQREFRAATILLITEDHPASKDIVDVLSRDVASYSFHQETGGRASIIMDGLSQFLKDGE